MKSMRRLESLKSSPRQEESVSSEIMLKKVESLLRSGDTTFLPIGLSNKILFSFGVISLLRITMSFSKTLVTSPTDVSSSCLQVLAEKYLHMKEIR